MQKKWQRILLRICRSNEYKDFLWHPDISSIRKFNKKSIVKGFTTNPSLMRKAGAKDYKSYSKQILKVCRNKPISFEVFADDQYSMIEQGRKINSWGKMYMWKFQ